MGSLFLNSSTLAPSKLAKMSSKCEWYLFLRRKKGSSVVFCHGDGKAIRSSGISSALTERSSSTLVGEDHSAAVMDAGSLVLSPNGNKGQSEIAIKNLSLMIINAELFKCLQQTYGKSYQAFMLSKLVPVVGNICESNLRLEEELANLIASEIDVIVNSAANTTFDERYDVAVDINTRGPCHLIGFAKKSQKLKLFLQQIRFCSFNVNGQRQGRIMERPLCVGDCIAKENFVSKSTPRFPPTSNVENEMNLALNSEEAFQENEVAQKMRELGLEERESERFKESITLWQGVTLTGIVSWIVISSRLNVTHKIRSSVQPWVTHNVITGTPLILQIQDVASAPRPKCPPVRRITATKDEEENALEYGLPSSHTLNTVCLSGKIYLGMHSLIDVICGLSIWQSLLSGFLFMNMLMNSLSQDKMNVTNLLYILASLAVTTFWTSLSFLLLFAYPTPEFPTPSFEYHTAFNGVAFGIFVHESHDVTRENSPKIKVDLGDA
ncbi:hypothetical protein GH714_031266 [Hevea brasiliensis]|uniref:Fatty acyl-CoA reductase n=1 Tax=Hevea brasiliensis TaxID=3981 RepID=A0A6A6M215_HEVBR|nr:hypothetical protein GH714_031266 [Hevea brasiliensis]